MNKKPYNTEISYRPKYDYVLSGPVQMPKFKKPEDIQFQDSRFDIFYGVDKHYTQQMLIEDDMAGPWSIPDMQNISSSLNFDSKSADGGWDDSPKKDYIALKYCNS